MIEKTQYFNLNIRYSEVCDPGYKFEPPSGFTFGTGHFTQVVWKESTKLGIGKATGKYGSDRSMDCVYTVGRYRVAGNMMGNFKPNVLQGILKF